MIGTQNHPFAESKKALEQVEVQLNNLLQRLNRPNTSDTILRSYCKVALNELTEIIPLIGFIERSTEVTGPVEFFGPFSRITKCLVDEGVKLILSSTWQFNPHTIIYPDQVAGVANCVFVGFPVSESDNALLTPLAAHEVGHNVWQKRGFENHLKNKISETVANILKTDFKDRFASNSLATPTVSRDLFGDDSWYTAYSWASKQLEKCFCDFLGGYLFGPAYLYAFAHYSCPGIESGDPKYPPTIDRHTYLLAAADNMKWDLNPSMRVGLFDSFSRSADVDASQLATIFLEVADRTRECMVEEVRALALQVATDAGLLYSQDEIERVRGVFEKGLPAVGVLTVAAICNAGWNFFIKKTLSDAEKSVPYLQSQESSKLINELMLKSFEIFEIETVLKEPSQCLTQMPLTN